ncbi:MAG: MATE family efflux transporter, partial [Oscillospiraceae bacterium]
RFHGPLLARIFKIGVPGGLQSVMYSVSNLLIQVCINAFGASTMAMWTAYGKIDAFGWMILGAFGIAITTFVGQNFGAGDYQRVKKSIRVCLLMTAITMSGLIVLLFFFSEPLFAIFSNNPEIVHTGAYYIKIIAPFYLVYLFVEILSGAMRGVGETFIPLLITIFGICVFRVIWCFTAVPYTGDFMTVVLSYPITWVLTGGAFIVYYLRGKWLTKRMTIPTNSQK